jgi:hypothetical protein
LFLNFQIITQFFSSEIQVAVGAYAVAIIYMVVRQSLWFAGIYGCNFGGA